MPPDRSFNWFCLDIAIRVDLKEPFWRGAENSSARPFYEGGVGRRVDTAKCPVQIERIDRDIRRDLVCQTDLICLSRADPLQTLLEVPSM